MAQIGSWKPQPHGGRFFSASEESKSISQFYSQPGTSLYNTLLGILTPAIRIQLPCLSRHELYNAIGPRLGGGAQFDTFISRIVIPGTDTPRTAKLVAIKQMHREDDGDRMMATINDEIFRRKLEDIMAEFRFLCHPAFREHDNIIKLLAYGWEQDFASPVLVLEYAELGNLESYLVETPEISWDLRRQICLDVAAGLEMLHAANVTHGDLKPRNILMFEKEKEGKQSVQAKLSDFGLSVGEFDVEESSYHGTALWIPPEAHDAQHKISTSDISRCDVYSLGLVIWTVMRKEEDFVDEAWVSPADLSSNEPLEEQPEAPLHIRFRQLALEHPEAKPPFRKASDYPDSAIKKLSTMGHGELLAWAVGYARSVEMSTSDESASSRRCFIDALNGTLQDDPKMRKSASEIMAILALSDTQATVSRPTIGDQDFKIISYNKTDASLSMIWGARRHFNLPFAAQKVLRAELESLAAKIPNHQSLIDLALCYAEGVGGAVELPKMMDTLKTAALAGSRPAASLFVRMGGAIDFTENGTKDAFAILNPSVTDGIEFLVPKSPRIGFDENSFYVMKLRIDAMSERIRKAPKAFDTTQERPLLPGDYYYQGVHALEIGDICNRWLHYFIHQGSIEGFNYFIEHPKSSHFSYDCRNMDLETPLLLASRYGLDFAAVGLVTHGADPNLANPSGVTPLHYLSMFNDRQIPVIAQLFSAMGAKLDSIGVEHWPSALVHFMGTPLQWAVQMRCAAAVESLLDLETDATSRAAHAFHTPLAVATNMFAHEIVEILLRRVVHSHQASGSGEVTSAEPPPFHAISASLDLGHTTMAKLLIHGEALPSAVDRTIEVYLKHGQDIDEMGGETRRFSLRARTLNPTSPYLNL